MTARSTPSRRRRPLYWLLLTLCGVLVLSLGLLAFVVGTDAGLRLLRAGVDRYGGTALQIRAVHGRLLGRFELDDVRYRAADGMQARWTRLTVDWSPAALLHRRLVLRDVALDGLQVTLAGGGKTASPPTALQLPAHLPIGVQIERLTLDGVVVRHPDAPPLKLSPIQFSGSWIGARLEIRKLSAGLPRIGPVTLNARAHTGAHELRVARLQISGPGEITLDGTLGYGRRHSDLELAWKKLQWPLRGDQPDLTVPEGSARLTGTLADYRYTMNTGVQRHGKTIAITLDGRGGRDQTDIEKLDLDVGKDGSATASGQVQWHPQMQADLQVTLHGLDPALLLPGWNGRLNGHLQAKARRVDAKPQVRFTLKLAHSTLRGQSLAVDATGRATSEGANVESLNLSAAKGRLSAKGTVAWRPRLAADLTLQLRHLDPAVFVPAFPGDLNGTARVRTTGSSARPRITLQIALDHSTLRGQPLSLQGRGSYTPRAGKPAAVLQDLALKLGDTRLNASGSVLPPFAVNGRLDSPDLSVLAPTLRGRASLAFSLHGTLSRPHLVTHGQARGIRRGRLSIAALDWSADLDPLKPSKLNVTLHDATAGTSGLKMSEAVLSANGIEKYQHIHLHAVTTRGSLDLRLAGGYDRKRQEWGGQIQSLKLTPSGLAPWSLQNAPGLLLGSKRLSLESTCLIGRAGKLCVDLQKAVLQPGVKLSWSLNAVELSAFMPLLPKGDEVGGRLYGKGDLRWLHGDIARARATLRLTGARFKIPGAPALHLRPSRLTLQQSAKQALHADLDLAAPQGGVKARVDLAAGSTLEERRLGGNVRITVPDLATLQPFLPQLESLKGHIDGSLDLAGTLRQPRLQGRVALADGSAALAAAGIDLSNIQLTLSGRGDGPLAVSGSMMSGGGTLKLSGTLDPSRIPLRADLQLKGQNFLAMNTPDARVRIAPDLHLVRDGSGIHLDGGLTVPKAELTPRGGIGGNSGVSVSPDQQIVGTKAKPKGPPLRVFADLKLKLGDAVRFAGYGLKTRIIGAVALHEKPERAPTAKGELRLVDGRYQAYGQDLIIKTGRLIFDGGPVTQPAVDLLAVRKPRADIEVGVQVRGTLDKPRLTLTSTPPMRREEQLSWLLFGHPLAQNSSADQGAIAGAALALGLSGGDYLANNIGKKLGLDTVSLGSPTSGGSAVAANPYTIAGSQEASGSGSGTAAGSQAAQLMLGKYLTPRLYVSYGVGLLNAGQTFRLQYDLGRGFKLQTESGTENGGDLIYTFDGGK